MVALSMCPCYICVSITLYSPHRLSFQSTCIQSISTRLYLYIVSAWLVKNCKVRHHSSNMLFSHCFLQVAEFLSFFSLKATQIYSWLVHLNAEETGLLTCDLFGTIKRILASNAEWVSNYTRDHKPSVSPPNWTLHRCRLHELTPTLRSHCAFDFMPCHTRTNP